MKHVDTKGRVVTSAVLLLFCVTGMAYGQPTASAEKLIRADLMQYTPGTNGGIGEPVQESRNIADEWEAAHPAAKSSIS